jgi:hypothetical protein
VGSKLTNVPTLWRLEDGYSRVVVELGAWRWNYRLLALSERCISAPEHVVSAGRLGAVADLKVSNVSFCLVVCFLVKK